MQLNVWLNTDEDLVPPIVLDTSSQPVAGFTERCLYRIECPAGLSNAQLYADDACLPGVGKYWLWQPGFYAGEVDLELVLEDKFTRYSWRVDVSSDPQKSGKEVFQQYIIDIAQFDSSRLPGSEPAQHQLGGISRFASVWLRYARVKQFFPRYLQGLKAVLECPVSGYQQLTKQHPLGRLKQITPAVFQQLIQHADQLQATPANSARSLTDIRQLQVQATLSDMTFDTPANRQLSLQLKRVRHRVGKLLSVLQTLSEETAYDISGTRTSVTERLDRRIDYLTSLQKQLRNIAEQMPFSVARTEQSFGLDFDAVAGHPHYQLTWGMGVRLLREGISGLASDEYHHLIPSWQVYETWCFVAIAEALKKQFAPLSWKLSQHPERLTLQEKREGMVIRLHGQKSFPALLNTEAASANMPCSISLKRIPDLVLEVTKAGATQFICLDSKYTSSKRRILEEMVSAHVYQDSLRWQQKRPVLSLLLVPRNEELNKPEEDSWWRQHQTGCFTLNSAEDASELVKRLWDIIDRACYK